MPTKRKPQIFNASQAAEKIGCSISTVTRWAERLELGQKIGASVILTESDVREIALNWKHQRGNPEFGTRYRGGRLQPE